MKNANANRRFNSIARRIQRSWQWKKLWQIILLNLLALLTAIALKRILMPKQFWIAGCLGAVAHSVGQMIVAVLLTGTPSLVIYLPVMIVCGVITGLFTGLCAQLLVNRGKNLWKTFLK